MTTVALAPAWAAAQATAAPWLPAVTHTRPRWGASRARVGRRLRPPRAWNEPVFWTASSLTRTWAPVRPSRVAEVRTGVRCTWPAIRVAADRTAAGFTFAPSCNRSGGGSGAQDRRVPAPRRYPADGLRSPVLRGSSPGRPGLRLLARLLQLPLLHARRRGGHRHRPLDQPLEGLGTARQVGRVGRRDRRRAVQGPRQAGPAVDRRLPPGGGVGPPRRLAGVSRCGGPGPAPAGGGPDPWRRRRRGRPGRRSPRRRAWRSARARSRPGPCGRGGGRRRCGPAGSRVSRAPWRRP